MKGWTSGSVKFVWMSLDRPATEYSDFLVLLRIWSVPLLWSRQTNLFPFYCSQAAAGSRPCSWTIWDFWFNGSMVHSICDCSALKSAVCLSECLAAAPVFLLGATPHFVLFSCKICAEIVARQMFAVFLNGLNSKNSSRSSVQNILLLRYLFATLLVMCTIIVRWRNSTAVVLEFSEL